MLTIKDAKAFKGLDQKAVIKEMETVGRNASQDTVYAKAVAIAIGAGMTAKADGIKSYSFDRAFDAFAKEYMPTASGGSLTAYRSSFGTFCKAGMKAEWDASEIAVKCFNERSKGGKVLSLTQRSGMLNRLMKLDHVPTANEIAAEKPEAGNRDELTADKAAAALLRSVDSFGVKWLDKLTKDQQASYKALRGVVDTFATTLAGEAPAEKPKAKAKGKGKASEPTPAEQRKAMLAKLAAINVPSKGSKTIQ